MLKGTFTVATSWNVRSAEVNRLRGREMSISATQAKNSVISALFKIEQNSALGKGSTFAVISFASVHLLRVRNNIFEGRRGREITECTRYKIMRQYSESSESLETSLSL